MESSFAIRNQQKSIVIDKNGKLLVLWLLNFTKLDNVYNFSVVPSVIQFPHAKCCYAVIPCTLAKSTKPVQFLFIKDVVEH